MSNQPISESTRREVAHWATAGPIISEVAAADIAQRFGILDDVQHGRVGEVRAAVAGYRSHPAQSAEDRVALEALLDFSSQSGRY